MELVTQGPAGAQGGQGRSQSCYSVPTAFEGLREQNGVLCTPCSDPPHPPASPVLLWLSVRGVTADVFFSSGDLEREQAS